MATTNQNRRATRRCVEPSLSAVRTLLTAALLALFAVVVAAALRDPSGDRAAQVLTLLAPLVLLALEFYFRRRG